MADSQTYMADDSLEMKGYIAGLIGDRGLDCAAVEIAGLAAPNTLANAVEVLALKRLARPNVSEV